MTVRRLPGEDGQRFFIDTKKFTGKAMMAYGQTELPKTSMRPAMRPTDRLSMKPTTSDCTSSRQADPM